MGSTMQEMQTLRSTISSLLLELEERKNRLRRSGTAGSRGEATGGGKKKWQVYDELECAQYRLA
jgi:hypothetical protein